MRSTEIYSWFRCSEFNYKLQTSMKKKRMKPLSRKRFKLPNFHNSLYDFQKTKETTTFLSHQCKSTAAKRQKRRLLWDYRNADIDKSKHKQRSLRRDRICIIYPFSCIEENHRVKENGDNKCDAFDWRLNDRHFKIKHDKNLDNGIKVLQKKLGLQMYIN